MSFELEWNEWGRGRPGSSLIIYFWSVFTYITHQILKLLLILVAGLNTTVAIQSHRKSIPSLPDLGEALSVLNITVPVPRMNIPGSPGSGDEDFKPHFIQDATVSRSLPQVSFAQ